MGNQNRTDSSLPLEPSPDLRTRHIRSRATHATQDDVPHFTTERRDPHRPVVALERARACARIADENRAKDIVLLDLRQATPLVDFFVIATATSRRQSHSIASEVDQQMK